MRSGVEVRQTWTVTNVQLNQLAGRLECLDSDDDANDDDSAGLNVYDIYNDYVDTTINNQKQYFSHRLAERARSAWIARQPRQRCGGEIQMATPSAMPVDFTKSYTM